MPSRDGFLETILETPDDDAPRLVFSDWLEDQGDLARAELIRAQCEMTLLAPTQRRHRELAGRVEILLVENRARWIGELPGLDGVEWLDFERGFVSTVRLTDVKALYRHDRVISRAAPVHRVELLKFDESKTSRPPGAAAWLRTLRMMNRDEIKVSEGGSLFDGVVAIELLQMHQYHDLRWLTRRDEFPTLRVLRTQGSHTAGQTLAQWVGQHPSVCLRRLELGTRFVDYDSSYFEDPTMGPDGAVALAEASHLADLEALDLNRQRIGSRGFAAVVSSPNLSRVRELGFRAGQIGDFTPIENAGGVALRSLDLSLNQLGERGARSLGRSRRLASLEALTLDTCEIESKAMERLTMAPFWKTLRVLDLSRNPLGSAGAKVLAEAPTPTHLHTLDLVDCDFTPMFAGTLTGIKWLAQLLSLDLSRNSFSTPSITDLARLANGALRRLILASADLGAAGATALAPLWPRLQHLDLSNNPLTNDGLVALLQAGPANDLLTLKLSDCQLSAKGLGAFFKNPACPRLFSLDLSGNALGGKAIDNLLASPLAGSVREWRLSNCKLGDDAALKMAGTPALSNCSIINLRENRFDEPGLLALARSRHLAGVNLLLTGNPWSFKEASRKVLEDRFGRYWYHVEAEEEDDEVDETDFNDEFDNDDV